MIYWKKFCWNSNQQSLAYYADALSYELFRQLQIIFTIL